MSYQEYAHLRNGTPNGRSRASTSDATWQQKRAQRMVPFTTTGSSSSDERPYVGSHVSFSAPRPAPVAAQRPASHHPASQTHHSPNPSLSSTSLSPSNSASQKGLYNWKRRRAAAAQEPLPSFPPKEKGPGAAPEKKLNLVDVPLPWRPAYLQRRVLLAFLMLFITLGIALEAILSLSNQTPGLGPANRPIALRYAFQMPPVAILLLVAGAWRRVEYQARSSAPWMRMATRPSEARLTLLLDYVSMLRPAALAKAVRNRDFLVACAVAVSLALRGAVVVSTALVAPDLLTVTDRAAQLVVTSQFVRGAGLPLDGAGLSLAYVAGLQEGNASFPDGVGGRFAYQRFRSDALRDADAQIGATVDAFLPDLTCEPAALSVSNIRASQQAQQLDANFTIPGCSIAATVSGNGLLSAANEVTRFLNIGRGGCGGSTAPERQRVVVLFGTISIDSGSAGTGNTSVPVSGSITRSAQLVCEPKYTIKQTDLVKDDGSRAAAKLVASRPQSRQLDGVRPWDVVEGIFNSYTQASRLFSRELSTNNGLPQFLPTRVVVDPLGHFAFGLKQFEQGSLGTPDDYFNSTTLTALVSDYFQHHASILAFTSLSSGVEMPVQGTSAVKEDRLTAKPVVVHFVVALLGLCVLLSAPMILFAPAKGFLPRNPGTLMDTAALLNHSKPLLQALRGAGAADAATLRGRLGGAHFHTGVEAYEQDYTSGHGYFKILGGPLRPDAMSPEYAESGGAGAWPQQLWMHWSLRLASLVVMAALVAALEASLRVSQFNDGIATVGDSALAHLVWTAAPTLLFMLLAMYVGLVDFTIRAMAPFAELARGGSYRTMTTNLVDNTAPFAMYKALASGNWAAALSTASPLAASLLLVFVASAFGTSTLPAFTAVQLQTRDFFNTGAQSAAAGNVSTYPGVMASLALAGNASYPAFTYKDLVFPRVTLPPDVANESLPDTAIMTATLPAIRATLRCKLYTQSELRISLTSSSAPGNTINSIRIDTPNTASSRGKSMVIDMTRALGRTGSTAGSAGSADGSAFIGAARFIPDGAAGGGTWLYGWGQLSNANTDRASVAPVYALSCEEKMQRLSATVSFNAPSMVVEDVSQPAPILVEGSARDSSVSLSASETLYAGLAHMMVPGPHHLDGFFSQLVSSRYAVPLDTLGGGGQAAESVAAAVVAQHGIVRAQALSATARRLASGTATPVAADSPGAITEADSATGLPPGALVARARLQMRAGPPRRRRLRQDPVPTRVLEALLAVALAASAAAWLLTAATDDAALLLPRLRGEEGGAPLSVASVGALLADGNLFGLLGRGAEWKDIADLAAVFRDGLHVTMRFRLGWEDGREARRDHRATARRATATAASEVGGSSSNARGGHGQVLAISAVRTGGWGGGENVGLGLQARVGFRQRGFVRDWGWKT
ncbi:hypothetical protein RB601_002809 [Gaeumannomyces tritici]